MRVKRGNPHRYMCKNARICAAKNVFLSVINDLHVSYETFIITMSYHRQKQPAQRRKR